MKKTTVLLEYAGIALGSALMAFALHFFLEPNTIAPGGVTGLAVVIQRMTGIPMDLTNLVINIPLFLTGILILGKAFGAKTAYATLMLSLFLRLFSMGFGSAVTLTSDILLAAVYGGVAMGVGLGLVFRLGGTTGGTDLAGAILNHYFPSLSTAKMMMILDLVIVGVAGLVERRVETALYSIIALYILVKLTDFIVEDLSYAKAFYIISDKPAVISQRIISELSRGVTGLEAKGMYTGSHRTMLLCVVNRAEVAKLKKMVYEVDPAAFMMVTTIHEVLGEGFKEVGNSSV
ncbi:YitT family protein [Anoxynatronum sibiricum]|uniref:YitT family protein n=1 Tax=Anoxynatronum sibiricum TaxID=210623 RepID=A0ABU9VPW9_9CLOT